MRPLIFAALRLSPDQCMRSGKFVSSDNGDALRSEIAPGAYVVLFMTACPEMAQSRPSAELVEGLLLMVKRTRSGAAPDFCK
jgi:hypothetical protein